MEKKFKVGERVTFLSIEEAWELNTSPTKRSDVRYRYGGDEHGGYVSQIVKYCDHIEDGCWQILVKAKDDSEYLMLECEFAEYYNNREISNYQIF